jgi:flagellar basal body-associated protein FliL
MAEESNHHKPNDEANAKAATAEAKKPGKVAWWRRFLTRKWLVILVVASIVVHGTGFAYFRLADRSPPVTTSPEVSLGLFRFEAGQNEIGRITRADFSLHIALLEQVDRAARGRLEAYRFRVQQGVEQLLRRAHGGDFEDPSLGELKRQLQEQINETLGMRAIADVIITDLKLQHSVGTLGGEALRLRPPGHFAAWPGVKG